MDAIAAIGSVLAKTSIAGVAAKLGSSSLGEPFRKELLGIRGAIDDVKAMLEAERVALLYDAIDFILQDDLEAARRSLTQAKNREPASAVVRCWLGLVLASEGRDGAARELTEAAALNPFVIPSGLRDMLATGQDPAPTQGLAGWRWRRRGVELSFASLGAIDPIVVFQAAGSGDVLSLDRLDISTGKTHWSRPFQWHGTVEMATPRFVVVFRRGTYVLLSTVTGRRVATMRPAYYKTLFHPPYADAPDVHASNRSALLPVRFRSLKHPLRVDPAVETVSVEDPFGWGIGLRASTQFSPWLDEFNTTCVEMLVPN